ncbi:MAG: 3-phosphoshikimate 1-carboxyvinyltransferase [Planctomycetes bacterium]|nr:3-phosphoshikimate 1-carboxyvinyltransferase [Planctomycetota bacterium]
MTLTKKTGSAARLVETLHKHNPAPFSARIPGSKSYTNRALVLAALRMGTTEVVGGLDCDDTQRLAVALASFVGLALESTPTGFRVRREREVLDAPAWELHMGAAGTPARFMLAFAAAARGATVVTGTPRLCERPMGDILAALRALGIRCECLAKEGCLPVRVHGGRPSTNRWRIHGGVSSQFTSSLLLYAAQQPGPEPVTIEIEGHQVSRPYVEMTRALMKACGILAERVREDAIVVRPARPSVEHIPVEVDASGMSYFLAAAAVTGTTVEIPGIGAGSAQGDVGLARAFERMGCEVELGESSLRITGRALRGIDIDMETMPDVVLTLAVVAARAQGTTRITNIANLRVKECDRIHAAASELQRLGVEVEEGRDFLVIQPRGKGPEASNAPAQIHTYDDHRVAMAFGILGLVHEGITIEDPDCVAKSFPGFWQELARFTRHHNGGF